MSGILSFLLAQAATIVPGVPLAPPIAASPVAEPVLAEQRGGFRLPNGIDVALSVQTQTAINGAILLRTVFQVDRGAPSLTIYSPKAGEVVALDTAGGEKRAASATGPTISYDRMTGLQVVPGTSPSTLSVSAGRTTTDSLPAGLTQVTDGTPTDAGAISDTTRNGVRTVSLAGADLTITHLTGNAFGSAIANSGSDRTIDTQTTVSITLGNAGPDVLGSALFRVQDVALDAVAMRVH